MNIPQSSSVKTCRSARLRSRAAKPHAVLALCLLTALAAAPLHSAERSVYAEPLVAETSAGAAGEPAPARHDTGLEPRDAAGWFVKAKARVSAGFAIGSPDDYCDADNNWIFLALADLSEAMRLDAPTVTKMIFDDRTEFARFRDVPEFKLWWTATRPLPATDSELSVFYRNHPVWNRPGTNIPIRESLTLGANGAALLTTGGSRAKHGTWRVAGGKLVVMSGGLSTSYELARVPFFLLNGTQHVDVLTLGGNWTMGPILHDCAEGP